MATVPPYDDALAGARVVVTRYANDAGHLPRSLEFEDAARMLARAALRARVPLSTAVTDAGRIVAAAIDDSNAAMKAARAFARWAALEYNGGAARGLP